MERPRQQRDIVYCHECENEWYRDEHGLECPSCHSDFTEVVEAGHDPRAVDPPESPPFDVRNFPDPEEDDLDDLDIRTDGLTHTYLPRRSDRQDHGGQQGSDQLLLSPLFQGVASVIGNILGSRRQEDVQQRRMTNHQFEQPEQFPINPLLQRQPDRPLPVGPLRGENVSVRSGGGPGYRWQVTTSHGITHSFGTPTATLGGPSARPHRQDFTFHLGRGQPGFERQRTPGFGGSDLNPHAFHPQINEDTLIQLGPLAPFFVSLFDNPAMMHSGDAVFSQEALDRVITRLMEQNASGNAPGPATAEAIASLTERPVNKRDLGEEGKTECSICMEDVSIGDKVTELPCHHWFHGECVKAWLMEHDTCPHCRQGIMPREGSEDEARVRTSGEAPRHNQMWGQGEGTQDNPVVVPESPAQERSSRRRRYSSGPGASSSRETANNEGLFSRMRNAFGGGSSS